MSNPSEPNAVLVDLPRPTGQPELIRSIGQGYGRAARSLGLVAAAIRQRLSATVGQAWIGGAAASARTVGDGFANGAATAGDYAGGAATALLGCAAGWEAALAGYDRAVRLADQALEEERHHRARSALVASFPTAIFAEDGYQSPLRGQARALARQAVGEFQVASATCAKALAYEAGKLRPPPPPARGGQGGSWWEQGLHVVENAGGAVVDGFASLGNAAVNHLGDVAGVLGGLGLAGISGLGEGAGAVLDASGVGAIAGVPLDAVSTLGVAAGGGIAMAAMRDLGQHAAGDDHVEPIQPSGGGSGEGGNTPPGAKPGWASRTADNGRGTVWQQPGATGNADMVRIMDPTLRYPYGYVRFYNQYGQPVDLDGQPGPDPETHIPRAPDGSYPLPKGW